MTEIVKAQAKTATEELLGISKLKKGQILVVGCSTSEIDGKKIGTLSSFDTAKAVVDGILPVLEEKGIYIAAQCCEHLNRALVVEKELAEKLNLTMVNVVPQQHAGGSFATTVYKCLKEPVVVESISADAGIDIGDVLIGMHLKSVAVPVRISVPKIGEAHIVCARTRLKYIGGCRAVYDEGLE